MSTEQPTPLVTRVHRDQRSVEVHNQYQKTNKPQIMITIIMPIPAALDFLHGPEETLVWAKGPDRTNIYRYDQMEKYAG